ncbi:MAG TPA: type VI secretion system baseplate subunit TssK [Pyrinomonadaceae bacterium]|jgi:type VI secretion system protein ImpJ
MGIDGREIPDASEIPESIQWHEGLLLTPQHFQQLALRHETLLQYSAAMIAPFYWGIRYLEIDEASLIGGLVQIKQVEAVMPDGLVVSYRMGDDLQPVDLTKIPESRRQRLKIHLAVVASLSRYQSKENKDRYKPFEGKEVSDALTGEGKVRIPRLIPQLELIAGDKPSKRYVSFPLMEVEYVNDTYKQTDFIPPILNVTSRPQLGPQWALGKDLGDIAEMVRKKAQELAGHTESSTTGVAMRLDAETKSWIRGLTASLPSLEAMLKTELTHPYPVFLTLCSMAGHLAAMGPRLVPDEPNYNHNDLRASFRPVKDFIEQAVVEGLTSAYEAYPFVYQEGVKVYERPFRAEWRNRRLILALRAQPGVSLTDLVQWGKDCQIGSRRLLLSIKEKRIHGVERKHIEKDEELVSSRGVVLFLLKSDSEFIEPDEPLQIFNRGERSHMARPVEIILHVKKAPQLKS